MNNGLQLTLQQLMADWLANDPYFSNIPIITEFSKDIQGEINVALGVETGAAGQFGTCVVIVTPLAESNFPDQPGPYFDKVKLVARVIENVPINQDTTAGTGKRALDVAEFLHAIMKDFVSPSLLQTTNVYADKPAIVLGNDPDNVTYDCLFIAHGGISYVPNKVSDITATSDATHVLTATWSPSGAHMWYTLDGTLPVQGAGTSVDAGQSPLAFPIVVTPGQLFLGRAFSANKRSSKILAIQF